ATEKPGADPRTPRNRGQCQCQDGRAAGVHGSPLTYHDERSGETQTSAAPLRTAATRLGNSLLGADPDRTTPKMLLIPHPYDLLQSSDQPMTGGECLGPMPRADGDGDARLAHRDDADPVHHRDAADGPAPAGLASELAHLAAGHPIVGLVLETRHPAPRVLVARGAEGEHGGARRRITDRGEQARDIHP